jgi:hypothetical protein
MSLVSLAFDYGTLAHNLADWVSRDWAKVVVPAGVAILLWFATTRVSLRVFRKGGVIWGIAATIDKQRQGVKLLIKNTGRTQGVVSSISLVGRGNVVYDEIEFSGFTSGKFTAITIPAHGKAILVLNAENQTTIPKRTKLHVHAGSEKAAVVKPVRMLKKRAIYGTNPVLPPGCTSA